MIVWAFLIVSVVDIFAAVDGGVAEVAAVVVAAAVVVIDVVLGRPIFFQAPR